MVERQVDGIIGWTIALTITVFFGIFILYWRIVKPNPLVRVPVSLGLFALVAVVIAAMSGS